VILAGYRFFRELHESLGVKLYLTSIAAENLPARRLLERGLAGMPSYRSLCEFVTLVFRRSRGRSAAMRDGSVATAVELLSSARGQFAPVWSHQELTSLAAFGLRGFQMHRAGGCAAVWDQRDVRQAVIRAYPMTLKIARAPLNWIRHLTRLPWLPPIGASLSLAYVSHLVTPADQPDLIVPLVQSLSTDADCLAVGFDARDPRLALLKRAVDGREYRTQLYLVHWDDGRADAETLDDRLCEPEVALL
jgi:hypothetical protein